MASIKLHSIFHYQIINLWLRRPANQVYIYFRKRRNNSCAWR